MVCKHVILEISCKYPCPKRRSCDCRELLIQDSTHIFTKNNGKGSPLFFFCFNGSFLHSPTWVWVMEVSNLFGTRQIPFGIQHRCGCPTSKCRTRVSGYWQITIGTCTYELISVGGSYWVH